MDSFSFGVNLGISAYSLCLLIFIFIAVCLQTSENSMHPQRQRLFLSTVLFTAILIVADFFSRLDGRSGICVPLCETGNFILFFLNPALIAHWYFYVSSQLEQPPKMQRLGLIVQYVCCGVNALLVALTPLFGLVYFFDADHVYHRGPVFWITGFTMAIMVTFCEFAVFLNRRQLGKQSLFALTFFPAIPVAASILQVIFYGYAFALSGTAYAIMIVFVYAQSRSMDLDYLTGIYNRRKLDTHLQQIIRNSSSGKAFSAVLIDLDHFKTINDTLGHSFGDDALENATALLKHSLRADTFIARYGGDEFFVVLDVDNEAALRGVMSRIRASAEEFNRRNNKPYQIHFSMGGAVYDPGAHMKAEEYLDMIDTLMYQDKRANNAG